MRSVTRSIMLFLLITSTGPAPVWAADDADACQAALNTAQNQLIQQKTADAARVQPASTQPLQPGYGQPGGTTGDPITDMMNKMSEGNQRLAQLEQQRIANERQLASEKFKGVMDLEDQIHKFRTEDYGRRMAINDAETAKKRAQATIKAKCYEKAQEDYKVLLDTNNALARGTQFSTNSLGRAVGTKRRMEGQLMVFQYRCLTNPSTVIALQTEQETYEAKLKNFQIKSEEIVANMDYVNSKFGKLDAHYAAMSQSMDDENAIAVNAVKQNQEQMMMGLGFALMNSASTGQGQVQSAGRVSSIDDLLNQWPQLTQFCMSDQVDMQGVGVPADLMIYFTQVNQKCRANVTDPTRKCAVMENRPSLDQQRRTPSGQAFM